MTEKCKQHINNVVRRTFEIVQKVYDNETNHLALEDAGSRVIFPRTRNGELRVSEQELRFIFVEQLNKEINDTNWNVYYSVETPTVKRYRFSKGDIPVEDETGRSGNFDLVIHDSSLNRIALIEFKANNPEAKDYAKDFVKLENPNEESCLRYFIQIVKSANNGTVSSIKQKIAPKITIYHCYALTGEEITESVLDK